MQALRLATLLKTDSKTGVFSCEIWELFKNTFFYRTPPVAASENNEQQQLSEGFANIYYKIVSPILLQELINDFAVCKHCSGVITKTTDESQKTTDKS